MVYSLTKHSHWAPTSTETEGLDCQCLQGIIRSQSGHAGSAMLKRALPAAAEANILEGSRVLISA